MSIPKEDDTRECTCHPDDNPPKPCPRKFAASECRDAASFNSLREALAGGRQAAVNLASMMREGGHDKEEIKWCKVVDNIDAALNGVTQPASERETLIKALMLAEKADRIHSRCQECEDGAQAPEACEHCFPSADDARVARRNVLNSLSVRMRDIDRTQPSGVRG